MSSVVAPDAIVPELTETIVAGKWKLETRVGAGSFGEVWIARHLITGGRKALKLLFAEFSGADLSARFIREAQAASLTQSPHVVTVDDIGFDATLGRAYLIMELLRGESLFAHLTCHPFAMPAAEAVAVLAQIAEGIDAAHAAGVIHRDLKPENVVLTWLPDGSTLVKVLDFGIAKLAEGRASITPAMTQSARPIGPGTVGFIGTPGYASPEQMVDAGSVTARADVFALGICAFEMLAGAPYWCSNDPAGILAEVALGIFEPASRRAPQWVGLGPEFDEWFAKACAHDPSDRFASAGEAVVALETALRLTGPLVGPRPRTPSIRAMHCTSDHASLQARNNGAGKTLGDTTTAPRDSVPGKQPPAEPAKPHLAAVLLVIAATLSVLAVGVTQASSRVVAPVRVLAASRSQKPDAPRHASIAVQVAPIAEEVPVIAPAARMERPGPTLRTVRRTNFPRTYRAAGRARLYEPSGL